MKKEIIKKQTNITKNKNVLDNIQLSKRKRIEILAKTLGKTVVEILPMVNEISKIISIPQKYKNEVDSVRALILLNEFQNRLDLNEDFKNKLEKLLTSNAGLLLFNKIIRILNRGNFNEEYTGTLAEVLKKISSSDDLEKMFEEYDYMLSQVEKLSPQALIILSNFEVWRGGKFSGGSTVSGQTVSKNWSIEMADKFAQSKSIEDIKHRQRIAHAYLELESNRMLYLSNSSNVLLSSIGEEIYKYIH
ncbi:hypothetical protein D4R87_00610 [bacterium]|nr:MAG: hypothetical protein D4R87_00610 [bacterium]